MSMDRTIETDTLEGGDARALQQQLCREIGLSAVAAALQCSTLPDVPALAGRHTPAILPEHDVAA